MGSILCPPPRLRTEILLSVRFPTESVPTCVGCNRMSGGSLRVNLGSQRVARAVVSWLATVRGEDALLEDAVASREGWGREDASAKGRRCLSGEERKAEGEVVYMRPSVVWSLGFLAVFSAGGEFCLRCCRSRRDDSTAGQERGGKPTARAGEPLRPCLALAPASSTSPSKRVNVGDHRSDGA